MKDMSEHIAQYPGTELGRLVQRARRLRPFTERMLRTIGVRRGMRVLDVGCGIGDASMLAADLVGPSGVVVGIDADGASVELAGRRIADAGLHQAEIAAVDLAEFGDPEPFDVVVCHRVLVWRDDPAGFLRRAARFARPGGVVAIHEVEVCRAPVWPPRGSSAAGHGDVGPRLVAAFVDAALSCPNVLSEVTPPEQGASRRLPRAAASEGPPRNTLPQLSQYCAWVRLPRPGTGRRADAEY